VKFLVLRMLSCVTFDVLTAVLLKFEDVTLCGWENSCRRLEGSKMLRNIINCLIEDFSLLDVMLRCRVSGS
jgi:hypothetical protein